MEILITDTHFGIKANSITWLNSQVNFFYEQLIPFIKSQKEPVKLYHLGDIFDSRSTLNIYGAYKVRALFEDLCEVCQEIRIICGNHDYYSPSENEENINSVEMILSAINTHNCDFYIHDRFFAENSDELFVPWFRYYDFDELQKRIQNKKRVFIHNDLMFAITPEYKKLFSNYDVYSGHIHTPKMDGNLHTLGSVFALSFADCNSLRGFYTLPDDGDELTFHPNNVSIRYYRLNNEQIFKDISNIKSHDYIELYIDQENILKQTYIDRIQEISAISNNTTIIPLTGNEGFDCSTDFEKYDIVDICRQIVPDHLMEKFNKISLA